MTTAQHLVVILALISISGISSASTLSERYPADEGISEAPTVLLHEDFENGWNNWYQPGRDTNYLRIVRDAAQAHRGKSFLRSQVTHDDLRKHRNLGPAARHRLDSAHDELYWRMYVKFIDNAPRPHHWITVAATDGSFDIRGKANRRPRGDQAFWTTLDLDHLDRPFYYIYWHEMRSGRCNDGTTVPGCDGDQGSDYYYGNRFRSETGDGIGSDVWRCIELHVKANTPGNRDGEVELFMDGERQLRYAEGTPDGTWLRAIFHPQGCKFKACGEVKPFEGFDFRTDDKVAFRQIIINAYNQLNTFERKLKKLQKQGKITSPTQTILYDDLIVATERIGCMTESTDDTRSVD